MSFIDEIKKELKEFYDKQVKTFVSKNKQNIKELIQIGLTKLEKISFFIKKHWEKITILYFKYIHPTLFKYWRKLVYVLIVCKHYGKRFTVKFWDNVIFPIAQKIYRSLKWVFIKMIFPLVNNIYKAVDFCFNQLGEIIFLISKKTIVLLFDLFKNIFDKYFKFIWVKICLVLEKLVTPLFNFIIRIMKIILKFLNYLLNQIMNFLII